MLMHDDGTMENKVFLTDTAHATKFTIPSGDWAIKNIKYYAIRFGQGQGNDRQITVTICDQNLQSIYETRVNHGYVDTVSEKWYNMAIDPPLQYPGDVWVLFDTNSIQKEGIYIGVDTSAKVSNSKKGTVGGSLSDLDGSDNWMIRLELTKVSAEETE